MTIKKKKIQKQIGLFLLSACIFLTSCLGGASDETSSESSLQNSETALNSIEETEASVDDEKEDDTTDTEDTTLARDETIESEPTEDMAEIEKRKENYPTPIHGWDMYRNLDKISNLDTNTKTLQFSSFDRTGGNDKDGFDGTYSYLRREGSEFVIAEHVGSGEVQSIWFTRDGGNVQKTGKIMIELDGELVLDTSLQALVNGELGAPFVFPFVANADQTSGGVTIKVPMPYKESMRIMTSSNPQFYHVSYRVFASDHGIETFDPSYVPEDVIEQSKTWGHEDPKAPLESAENVENIENNFSLAAGEEISLASWKGVGQLWQMNFVIEGLVGAPPSEVVIDDGRAHVGTSSFTMKVDPANDGIVLIRRYDSISTNQTANIYVDDELAAQWTGQGIVPGGWVEEEVEIDAEFTAGKDSIQIRNEFVSAGMDFSEFHFFVDSVVNGERVRTDTLDVGEFVAAKKSEEEHNYSVTNQNWAGDRTYILPNPLDDEEDILRTDAILKGLKLQVYADGELRVDSPFGQFFGSGLGLYEVHTLMMQMKEDGSFHSWWPMPFAEEMEVKLINTSEYPIEESSYHLSWVQDSAVGEALKAPIPTMGYFQAHYEESKTVMGRDWTFLDTPGFGKLVGITHMMDSLQAEGNTRGYLEGDERFYIDGIQSPIWHGTGTEDFYEGGWYFNQGVFSNPMNGAPATEAAGMYGTKVQSDSNYRLLIGDSVQFLSSFDGGFEPGPQQDHSAHYAATTYWYGHPNASVLQESDRLDIADASSEEEHDYKGDGEINQAVTNFEGKNDKIGVNRPRRDAEGDVSFSMQIDPENQGVRLVRMADQSRSYQEVEVYVNGHRIGTWKQVLGNQTHRWLEDSFDIPSYYTEGLSSLTIELRQTEESTVWSASRYRAFSIVAMKEAE